MAFSGYSTPPHLGEICQNVSGPWSSVYNTFRRWQSTGCIDAILEALQLHLNEEGLINFDLWCIGGSNVKASKDAAGARKTTLR